jgi:hypothetical protein
MAEQFFLLLSQQCELDLEAVASFQAYPQKSR